MGVSVGMGVGVSVGVLVGNGVSGTGVNVGVWVGGAVGVGVVVASGVTDGEALGSGVSVGTTVGPGVSGSGVNVGVAVDIDPSKPSCSPAEKVWASATGRSPDNARRQRQIQTAQTNFITVSPFPAINEPDSTNQPIPHCISRPYSTQARFIEKICTCQPVSGLTFSAAQV